jgi:hypothetical protein
LRVTCLSFGPNREVSFPEAFFCNECKAYEGDKHADPKSRGKRTSRRYKCKGKHTDLNNQSNAGGQPMVYYASTKFRATFFAGNGDMPTTGAAAGERRGRSPVSERNQVPPAKKRGVGATLDILRSKISDFVDLMIQISTTNEGLGLCDVNAKVN